MKQYKKIWNDDTCIDDIIGKEFRNTFHLFNSDKLKCPPTKKLNKTHTLAFASGTFEFSKTGGLKYKNSSDDDSGSLICNCVPYVMQKVYSFDITGERTSNIVWSIYTKEANKLRSAMKDIQSDKYISSHLPHHVIVTSPKFLKYFLQEQSRYVPTINLYTYTGFIPEKYEYVHSGGIISKKHNNHSRSDLPIENQKTLVYYDISENKIVKNLSDIIALNPIFTLMLSYNLLSLTYSKYKDKRPQFVFTTYGESGTFKSTINMYIFGIFKETYDCAPINLKVSTMPSIHNIATQFPDCVVLNDDAAPSADGNDEMYKKTESISRAYGDGTGRTVMNGTTNIHCTKPVGLSAITAEFQPFRDTSDMARSIMYELKKNDISKEGLSIIQENKSAYIRFVTDYIGWICTLKDSYMEELNRLFLEGRQIYENFNKVHNRLPENFGWLYAGFKMFLLFVTERYGISKKITEKWFEIFQKAVKKSFQLQKYALRTMDEAKKFISTLNKLIATKQVNIATIYVGEKNKQTAQVNSATVGYYDGKYVYILFDEAYAATSKWLHNIGDNYALPKSALSTKLVNNGYVITSEKNRHKSKITVNGIRVSVLKFKQKHFNV